MSKSYDENRAYCKSISDKLDAIVEGRMYKCPECGEWVNAYYAGQECRCGCPINLDGDESHDPWEEVTLMDFFEDAYDFEIVCNLKTEYRACRIMVACGGPNVYINTKNKRVELFWWSDTAHYDLATDTCNAIDECMEEYFTCC